MATATWAAGSWREAFPVASGYMRRHLIVLRPNDDLLPAINRLLRANVSGAPVVDESGTYQGVLSEKGSMASLTGMIELAGEVGMHGVRAGEFMTRDLWTVSPGDDVFETIDGLLSREISGAPVLDDRGRFLGIFSEKTAMRALVSALHESLPGSTVEHYMNVDRNRVISGDDLLLDVAHKFQVTPYRRLPILDRNDRLVGQVSRRDVLRAEHRMAAEVMPRKSDPQIGQRLSVLSQQMEVGHWIDVDALTAKPNSDMLAIAQTFLNSPYRRLPVLDEDHHLCGMISRRDLLCQAAKILRPAVRTYQADPLYLSGNDTHCPEFS